MRKIVIKIRDLCLDITQQRKFLTKMGIKPTYITLLVFLSVLAALFEGVGVGLLIPVMKGIIEMDFGFVRQLPVFKVIVTTFPQLFVRPNSSIFILLLGIIFVAILTKNVLFYLSTAGIMYQVEEFSNNIRKQIFDRYMKFGKLFFDRSSQGYHHNLIMDFTHETAMRLKRIHNILSHIFLLIIYSAIMIKISWKLTAFVIAIPPIFFYSLGWLIQKIKKTSRFYADSRTKLSKRTYDIFSALPLIKTHNMEEKEKKQFGYESTCLAKFRFSMAKKQNFAIPLQEIITTTLFLLIISVMAFLFVRDRSVELAGFFVYFYLLRKITRFLSTLNDVRARLAESDGPLNEVMKIFDDKNKYFVAEGNKVFPGLRRSIEFKGLNFSYLPRMQVVKDITFSVEKGKMTAIVGPTGTGKTTLINLLLRFYDCPPSSIMIDGIDIRDFTLKSLREHMALVSQEMLLFNDTLKKNIAYGKDILTEDELIDMAKKTRLYDFIMNLPKGFDTYIGDRGIKLSGGEKQRISIARALIKGTEILLLDEATSSLDTETERLIQEAIDEAIKDRTTIVIAHRLSTIKNADKIVVMEDGRVIEQGSLDQLLEKKGKFYEYWQEQRFF